MTQNDGATEQGEMKLHQSPETDLSPLNWQKLAFQLRSKVLAQFKEVADYCQTQRKAKRPANTLKNQWARTEISVLSAMLAGLKDVELELLKARLEVIESAIER